MELTEKKEIPVVVRERLECPGRLDSEPNKLISRLNDLLKLPITERLSTDSALLGSYLNVQFKGHWSDVGVKVEQACSTNS